MSQEPSAEVAQPSVRSVAKRTAAVHAATAALLITAAILKAYQEASGPGVASLWSRLLSLALIEFELALGGLLLLNMWPLATWGISLATFTIFAGVSVRKAMAGAGSCGCFGGIALDPRATSVIDLLVIVLLLMSGARPASAIPGRRFIRATGIVIVALMLLAGGAVVFGAVPKRGIVAENNGYHDFGVVLANEAKHCEHTFVVHNTSNRPVRITSFKSSCGCTVAELPPSPIPPGGSARIRVQADWSGLTGTGYARVMLKTDNRWTPEVPLTINAEILGPGR